VNKVHGSTLSSLSSFGRGGMVTLEGAPPEVEVGGDSEVPSLPGCA
jgi:hypothetical protein